MSEDEQKLLICIHESKYTIKNLSQERYIGEKLPLNRVMELAKRLANQKGKSGIIAGFVAVVLLNSRIIYGKLGEDFLREKARKIGKEFNQLKYCEHVTREMLDNCSNEKLKQDIYESVKNAVMNNNNDIEAISAKTAIIMNEYRSENCYKESSSIEGFFKNGKIINSEIIYDRLTNVYYNVSKEGKIKTDFKLVYSELLREEKELLENKIELLENKIEEKLIYKIAGLNEEEFSELAVRSIKYSMKSSNYIY